jgi:hypothetical protein
LLLTGNWYEDRLAKLRTKEDDVQSGHADKSFRQDKLVKSGEPDTFRTQTVDVAESTSEPYTAADTMRTAITTNKAMQAKFSQV